MCSKTWGSASGIKRPSFAWSTVMVSLVSFSARVSASAHSLRYDVMTIEVSSGRANRASHDSDILILYTAVVKQ